MDTQDLWIRFWGRYPILFCGLNLVFLSLITVYNSYIFLLPLFFLWVPLGKKSLRLIFIIPLLLVLSTWLAPSTSTPPIDKKTTFDVTITGKQLKESRFSKDYNCYQGTLSAPYHHSQVFITSSNSFPFQEGFTYHIQGRLKALEQGKYILKPSRKSNIEKSHLESIFYATRAKVQHKIKRIANTLCKTKEGSTFIYGLFTGQLSSRLTKFLFTKYQLVHLLVISGFHLSIIILLTFKIIEWALGRRSSAILCLATAFTYCLLIGFSPSLLRAFVAASIYLIGILFGKRSAALNSLGAALIITVIVDVQLLKNIGFQFSYLVTAAILFFYPVLANIFVKTRFFILNQILKLISLNIAVQLACIPLSFYLFHKTSLLCLFLNLFYPFAFSALLYLTLFSFTFFSIPFINVLFFGLTEEISHIILSSIELPWTIFDLPIRISFVTEEMLIIFFSILFFGGALLTAKGRRDIILPI